MTPDYVRIASRTNQQRESAYQSEASFHRCEHNEIERIQRPSVRLSSFAAHLEDLNLRCLQFEKP